ncbi:MAG: ISLre2 family transposase [Acetivibrionales bacterium]|jgi:hypothetical protein
MYNSIQHFNEFGVKRIEETIKKFIGEKKDLADLVLGLQENLFELGRNIVKEVLEDMDEYLRNCGVRKKDWEIVRKDETGLLTSFGLIKYNRTYFKPKENGKRSYLVDEITGINPHDRVSADVVINAIDEAIDSSYKKAGKKAAYVDEITKQAVMNKIHQIEIQEAPIREKEKKEVSILYIEADEDHVSLQKKGKKKGDKERNNISMPKLVYVHEGIDAEKSVGKRTVLKNVRYFGGDIASEDLWLQVAQYIDKQYEEEALETIYISGDGASWIRQGLNWVVKSKFVLDNHHLNKYIKVSTAHLNNEAMYNGLRDALEWPDREMLKKVFKKILELTDSDTKREAVKDAQRYILNNWDGIEIKAYKGYEIVGCSAEGHVSHVLSDRLSSRPKGWSKSGADQMARLRIYKKNGGKIYDLVMLQKAKEQKKKKIQVQEQLIKSLRKSSAKYENIINTEITAVQKGHKTGLYKELRSIIGRCG